MKLPAVVSDRTQIILLFYKPSSEDPLLNRLVALFDPPYCHVEMAFPERYGDEPWYPPSCVHVARRGRTKRAAA